MKCKIRDKNKIEDLCWKNLIKCTDEHFKFVLNGKLCLKELFYKWLGLTFQEK